MILRSPLIVLLRLHLFVFSFRMEYDFQEIFEQFMLFTTVFFFLIYWIDLFKKLLMKYATRILLTSALAKNSMSVCIYFFVYDTSRHSRGHSTLEVNNSIAPSTTFINNIILYKKNT